MTLWLAVAVAAAGGCGAVVRLLLDRWVRAQMTSRFPYGTVLINLSGSLLLGLVAGAALVQTLPSAAAAVLGAGFLGGYTTFSTASVETVRLLADREWRAALLNGAGTLVVGVGLAAFGLGLGLQL